MHPVCNSALNSAATWAPCHASLQPKGSSFTGENKDFIRFVLGNDDFIPAFEEAISGMKVRTGSMQRLGRSTEVG